MDEVTTTVSIMGRSYSLRTTTSDEPVLADAARRIDEMARNFAKQFPRKDSQDLIAMAALLQVVQLVRLEKRPAASPALGDLEGRLVALDNLLDEQIQSK